VVHGCVVRFADVYVSVLQCNQCHRVLHLCLCHDASVAAGHVDLQHYVRQSRRQSAQVLCTGGLVDQRLGHCIRDQEVAG